MSFRPTFFAFALALALPLAGCSPKTQVATSFDPLTPFPPAATYSWDDAANTLPDDSRLDGLDLDALIHESVNEEFALKGYTPTTGASNYRMSYELTVHTFIAADNSKSTATLSLLLREAKSGRRVWLGFIRAETQVGLTREERKQRMKKELGRMLKDFPPKQRS